MENEEGQIVDIYIPRKCSWTNSLIEASDKASIQLNIAEIDANGRFLGDVKTYAINGYIRDHSESDGALWHLVSKGTKQASN